MRVRVVPVSTTPAVLVRIVVEVPYRMDWSMPQNWLEGLVAVRGLSSRVSGLISGQSAAHLRVRDFPCVFIMVGATKRQLAILD
jgi:hypothetical protein